jgi:hypothetical protein
MADAVDVMFRVLPCGKHLVNDESFWTDNERYFNLESWFPNFSLDLSCQIGWKLCNFILDQNNIKERYIYILSSQLFVSADDQIKRILTRSNLQIMDNITVEMDIIQVKFTIKDYLKAHKQREFEKWWNISRLFWIAKIKNDKECFLSILPKDIIREICNLLFQI